MRSFACSVKGRAIDVKKLIAEGAEKARRNAERWSV
jgi:hypothetical protein